MIRVSGISFSSNTRIGGDTPLSNASYLIASKDFRLWEFTISILLKISAYSTEKYFSTLAILLVILSSVSYSPLFRPVTSINVNKYKNTKPSENTSDLNTSNYIGSFFIDI